MHLYYRLQNGDHFAGVGGGGGGSPYVAPFTNMV